MSLSWAPNILICHHTKPLKVHLWRVPEKQKRWIRIQVQGLTLAVPSLLGTLKSLSFSRCLLITSAGPVFSTALRDEGRWQLAHFRSLCVHEGVEKKEDVISEKKHLGYQRYETLRYNTMVSDISLFHNTPHKALIRDPL